MKAAVILNPTAGQGKPSWFQVDIEKEIRKYGMDCEIFETTMSGEGTILAREAANSGFDIVVAAGGDGTVNEVANGLATTGVTLGILPMGTVNVLARELNIPLDLKKAIRNLSEGVIRKIDLGIANDRYFTLMTGFGFDAEIVSTILQPIKDMIGASAYVFKGLEKLATYSATEVTLEMAEQTYTTKAFLVIVANAATYTYRLKIAPYASPDDGLLDICIFEQPVTDKLGFMRQLTDLFMNRHLEHDEVSYFRTTKVRVSSVPDVAVQIDGDAFGTTPVDISIAPQILPVIVPAQE
ncbi:MAG: diacylglycerol/lipid kinase family protein [Armatimonadota bacterium]